MYGLARWISREITSLFFHEITVVGLERIPINGPVIFVGNHNNKFVDASLMMATIPRKLRFLIATVSLRLRVLGPLARMAGAVGVSRSQDMKYAGMGRIIDLAPALDYPFPRSRRGTSLRQSTEFTTTSSTSAAEPSTVAEATIAAPLPSESYPPGATVVIGDASTRFLIDLKIGDHLKIEGFSQMVTVIDIIDDLRLVVRESVSMTENTKIAALAALRESTAETEVESRRPAESNGPPKSDRNQIAITKGLAFTVYPKVDQGEVFEAVVDALYKGHCIAIFPEGGSHDQPKLLPLKPGVAIMALTAAQMGVEDVVIVPLGIHYYQRHKFASKAVVEVGEPLTVDENLLDIYVGSGRRQAVEILMSRVKESLLSCMISAKDYDTLKAIELSASLYPPERVRLTPEKVHQLYALFAQLFNYFENDPATENLKKAVLDYAAVLDSNGLEDDEVKSMKQTAEGAFWKLLELTALLGAICVIAVPSLILMGPLRLILDWMTEKHRRQATAESTVKVHGDDVIASYKILWLMVALPLIFFLAGVATGIVFFPSAIGVTLSVIASLLLLPIATYHSMTLQVKVMPLLKQIRCCYRVIASEIDVWRDKDRVVLIDRIDIQLKVRHYVKSVLEDGITRAISCHNIGGMSSVPSGITLNETLSDDGISISAPAAKARKLRELQTDLERIIPLVLLEADTRRLIRAKDRFIPVVYPSGVLSREEIL